MKKKRTLQATLAISLLMVMIPSVSYVYADGFYTIIGPDGRPMVVPMKIGKKEEKNTKQKQETHTEKPLIPVIQSSKKMPSSLPEQKRDQPKPVEVQVSPQKGPATVAPVIVKDKITSKITEPVIIPPQPSKSINNNLDASSPISREKTTEDKTRSAAFAIEKLEPQKVAVNTKTLPDSKKPDLSSSETKTESLNGFSEVDGVNYVNSEYLENQEFNLDGKKRFYTMPDGTGRLETIERKKGVSRSVLDKFLNRAQQPLTPIALSETYIRLSSEELKSAFENDRCFLEGYTKSIKTLTLKKDVGVWPKKPIKEKFEYELVKLDPSIQYMQIDSYASTNENPVYYWPLIVFLDEKGCIEEGVSGFKNKKTTATVLQHAAIQGILKVPQNARYIMMTPLASAVDVAEQELSNQGQIKISVLQ
ncbi:hypothetical protein F971_00546 [Acinetobacter vivianii]|uniref:FilE C-terminal domain-containing protein n=1 Tax=Acinetobacter vivianii TaxID=1776742 RepID=N8WF32_9GAMM|nr:putative pilus assembly protein FilE [Acinetobacter vivianii]ENU93877.1 hypothetical protein F971_00546 [Acinetobacter vivianii]